MQALAAFANAERGEQSDERSGIQAEISSIDTKLHNFKHSIECGIDPLFLKDRIFALQDERNRLTARLASLKPSKASVKSPEVVADEVIKLAKEFQRALRSDDPRELKASIRHFVERIEVNGQNRMADVGFYAIPGVTEAYGDVVGKEIPEVGNALRLQ